MSPVEADQRDGQTVAATASLNSSPLAMYPSTIGAEETTAQISAVARAARCPYSFHATTAVDTTSRAPNRTASRWTDHVRPIDIQSHRRNTARRPCGRSTQTSPYSDRPCAQALAIAR